MPQKSTWPPLVIRMGSSQSTIRCLARGNVKSNSMPTNLYSIQYTLEIYPIDSYSKMRGTVPLLKSARVLPN